MEIKEIERVLLKLQKVGVARCQSCKAEVAFSEINEFDDVYLCNACLRKTAWRSEETIDLPT